MRKRRTSAAAMPCGHQARSRLTSAPATAASANMRRGGSTSGRLSTAEASAPTTKPAWTAAVSQAAPVGESAHAASRAGSTAVAENHSVMASSSPTASSVSWRMGRCGGKRGADDVAHGRGREAVAILPFPNARSEGLRLVC